MTEAGKVKNYQVLRFLGNYSLCSMILEYLMYIQIF